VRAITFQGVESLSFQDVPDPALSEPGDVLVTVAAAGLCGSDLHPYFGRETGLDVGTVMGHEFVGTVTEVGSGVQVLQVGDRVVAPFTTSCGACFYCAQGLTARCDKGQLFGWVQGGEGLHGAQAQAVRVPLADTTLVRVPEGLDDGVALLAGDILSTALFGADIAGVKDGDVVAVVGCGPVGLLAIRAALSRGAEAVVAVDAVESRLGLARSFGAIPANYSTGDPRETVDEVTGGRGADRAIEAVGSLGATRTAADLLRPGGALAAVGVHTEPHLAVSPGEMYDRNLTYAAGRCSARHYLPEALKLAARESGLLEGLISHRLPLERGVEAYRRFGDREEGWAKVVLLP
jgi:threonine dehydrogenase-like Zn-dependent dehydrogenase